MSSPRYGIIHWETRDGASEMVGDCYISPEQAALGAMTDGEVAAILVFRARGYFPSVPNLVYEAGVLGLWPPEVGEDA